METFAIQLFQLDPKCLNRTKVEWKQEKLTYKVQWRVQVLIVPRWNGNLYVACTFNLPKSVLIVPRWNGNENSLKKSTVVAKS